MNEPWESIPESLDAERAVLGSILLDSSSLSIVIPILSPEDFADGMNERIFRGMLALSERSAAVDSLTIKEVLNGDFDTSYISKLVQGVPDIGNIAHYARIVKDASSRRRLSDLGRRLQHIDPEKPVATIVAEARAEFEGVAAGGDARPPLKLISAAALTAKKIPPRRLILAPWWGEGEQPLVWGWRGAGKSWITLGSAAAIAAGGSFLRWKAPEALRVLFVDGEMMSPRIKERLLALELSASLRPDGNLNIFTPDEAGRLLNLWKPEDRVAVERAAAETVAQVIVFDNIASLYRTDNPRLASNTAEWWEPFQTWLLGFRARGIATLTALHAGKDDTKGPRGASAIEDLVELSMKVSQAAGHKPGDPAWFTVEFTKTRDYLGPGGEEFEAKLEGGAWTVLDEEGTRSRAKKEQQTRQRKKYNDLTGLVRDFRRSNPSASGRDIVDGIRTAGHHFSNADIWAVVRQSSTVDVTGRPGRSEVDE